MSLHNGLDTMAIATLGVYSANYGAAQSANIANLYASFGYIEDVGEYVAPTIFKRLIDWFWEFF